MLKADTVPLPQLLRLCKQNTPDGLFMSPLTLMDFRYMLRLGEYKLGIKVGWSPHSGRAGFATDKKLVVTPFEEIREGGRWQPDSSLRTYLEVVGATAVLKCLRTRGLAAQLRAAEELWPAYFGLQWQPVSSS